MPINPQPLIEHFDALLVDLDGVLQLDDRPIKPAVSGLVVALKTGIPVAYVTNNAIRTPAEVGERLAKLGVPATPAQVVTSAVAAASLLASQVRTGSGVFVVGGPGLREAVTEAGLEVVVSADANPVAVVVGLGLDVTWRDLAEATVALRAGARWIATNRDATLPSPRGPLPGAGSLIAALVTATGREPDVVVGKPAPTLFEAARAHTGGSSPLVVGDRLDTDIAGANAAGLPSLLVLTGVSQPQDLLAASPPNRPTYVGADLSVVNEPYPEVVIESGSATCGATTVRADGTSTTHPGSNAADLDGLRAAAALAWAGQLPPERFSGLLTSLRLG